MIMLFAILVLLTGCASDPNTNKQVLENAIELLGIAAQFIPLP